MSTQPEALRLAAIPIFERSITWQSQATIELRRLHEENAELKAQRDSLLEALKVILNNNECLIGERLARAAIKAVEEGK